MTHNIPKVDAHEPPPVIDDTQEATWNIVIRKFQDEFDWSDTQAIVKLMQERKEFGFSKHKTYLTPHNGRDSIVDAIQEQLDCVVYLMNAIIEEDDPVVKKFLGDSFDMSILVLKNIFIAWEMKNKGGSTW